MATNKCALARNSEKQHPYDEEASKHDIKSDRITITTPCDLCGAVRRQVFEFEKYDTCGDGVIGNCERGPRHDWGKVEPYVNARYERDGKERVWTVQFCRKCASMREHVYLLATETITAA